MQLQVCNLAYFIFSTISLSDKKFAFKKGEDFKKQTQYESKILSKGFFFSN